jgi:DNA-binding HxlR family transcriptional regulator
MDVRRIYRHYCMMARALEVVGERWSLLIVRDLLLGPRRFTDLVRGLTEITPTRLTERLRQLEAAGIVEREPPAAGREVWYRLTAAGQALAPTIDALALWAIEHLSLQPREGEPVNPIPVMIGTKVWLSRNAPQPHRTLYWLWRFPGHENYAVSFQRGEWTLTRSDQATADVIVEATANTWVDLLTAPPRSRTLPRMGVRLHGEPSAVDEFARTFAFRTRPPRGGARRQAEI